MSLMPSRMMIVLHGRWLVEYVAIETRERVGAGDVVQKAVAADALVEHGDVCGSLAGLKAPQRGRSGQRMFLSVVLFERRR